VFALAVTFLLLFYLLGRSLMDPARSHAAATFFNGALVVAGGSIGSALKTQDINQVETFTV
jgi:hypothetical protein